MSCDNHELCCLFHWSFSCRAFTAVLIFSQWTKLQKKVFLYSRHGSRRRIKKHCFSHLHSLIL
uniref:Uncharacterized protein n=1 Tax=Poecilia reticulata TaxID=8081 RepID=A0A3P9PGQ9_POERE